MSDPQRYVPPPSAMSREDAERVAAEGRKLQDRCPGALTFDSTGKPERARCGGVVVQWRRGGYVYRAGLCAGCSGREMRENADARERNMAANIGGARKRERFASYGAK
jgi:hypothetical protein